MQDAKRKAELVKKYPTEQVFVVPYAATKNIPDKFTPTNEIRVPLKSWESKGQFVLRHEAEYNAAFQQLIPYILVVNYAHDRVYVTERIAGEERLRGRLALGCGGHINPIDSGSILINGALREMHEELNITAKEDIKLSFEGYIRDLTSATNDHLGMVFVAEAGKVSVKEKENLKGKWMRYPDLIAEYERFESWARHIIDYLYITHSEGRIF